jgi:hypothetical protein
MAHDHSHEDRNSYYLNQLFTIAVCGALGGVTVMLWYSGKLRFLVVERFWLPTLIGGLSLLFMVLIRAIAVWRSVDEPLDVSHQHDHEHAHCGHDHDHCDHDHTHEHDHPHAHDHHEHTHGPGHDHGHEHGWAPWRYVVLLLPVVLYFLNLPNESFSAAYGDRVKDIQFDVPTGLDRGDERSFEVGFDELQRASLSPMERDNYEGKTVSIIGKYSDVSDTRFTLVRFKMACCARDAVPLNAVIMVDPKADQKIDRDKYRDKWVEVRGQVHFFEKPGSHEFITALILYPTKDKPIGKFLSIMPRPPANVYLN